jgi:translation initiation factor IF-1
VQRSTKKKSSRKKNRRETKFQEDRIYFEGKVIETFPATVFGVEIQRKNGLAPLIVKAGLKTVLKLRKVMIIRGDNVKVEINPEDMASEDGILKGTIIERVNIPRPTIQPL